MERYGNVPLSHSTSTCSWPGPKFCTGVVVDLAYNLLHLVMLLILWTRQEGGPWTSLAPHPAWRACCVSRHTEGQM